MFSKGLSPEIKNILQHIRQTSVYHDEEGVGILFFKYPHRAHGVILWQYKIYTQDEIDPLHEIPIQGIVKYSVARTGQDKVVIKRFPRRDAAFAASVDLLKQHRYAHRHSA
jgi:hypothetical protein